MKKVFYLLILTLFVLIRSPFVFAELVDTGLPDRSYSCFPSSLKEINEEAFLGTGFQFIILGNNLERIDGRAFADITSLYLVYIPKTVTFIADTAFENDNGLTIQGEKNSYANSWAESNGFTFVHDYLWTYGIYSSCFFQLSNFIRNSAYRQGYVHLLFTVVLVFYAAFFIRDKRIKKRPELHSIAYHFP